MSDTALSTYRELLTSTMNAPRVESVRSASSVGSGWGEEPRPFRELIGVSLRWPSPHTLLRAASRPVNEAYARASSAWIVLGRNDVASIGVFNSRGFAFSADGYTLSGAFGARMRADGGDQIEAAIELLRTDATTRRALAVISRPADVHDETRDFPCASSVQFFLRAGSLQAHVTMRSQSLFGVFPYDLVNFGHLRDYVAHRLGVTAGGLSFSFGSLHVYEAEEEKIARFLTDEDAGFFPAPELRWEQLAEDFSAWVAEASRPDPGAQHRI